MKLQGQVAVCWSYPPESSGRMAVKIEKLLYVLIGVRFWLHLFPAFIGLLAVQLWASLREGPSIETVWQNCRTRPRRASTICGLPRKLGHSSYDRFVVI